MSDEVSTALEKFVRDLSDTDPSDEFFGPDVDLFDYGYLDSFGIVNMIEFVDRRYRVDLSSIDFYSDGFRTIREIAGYIDSRLASPA